MYIYTRIHIHIINTHTSTGGTQTTGGASSGSGGGVGMEEGVEGGKSIWDALGVKRGATDNEIVAAWKSIREQRMEEVAGFKDDDVTFTTPPPLVRSAAR